MFLIRNLRLEYFYRRWNDVFLEEIYVWSTFIGAITMFSRADKSTTDVNFF